MELDQLGVEAVDDSTLKVTLTGPTVFFRASRRRGPYFPVPKARHRRARRRLDRPGKQAVSNARSWMDQVEPLTRASSWSPTPPTPLARHRRSLAPSTRSSRNQSTQSFIAFENDDARLRRAGRAGSRPDHRRNPSIAGNLIQFPMSKLLLPALRHDQTRKPTRSSSARRSGSHSAATSWPTPCCAASTSPPTRSSRPISRQYRRRDVLTERRMRRSRCWRRRASTRRR